MCKPRNVQRVLIYGLDAALLETRRLLLAQAGYRTEVAANRAEFLAQMAGKPADFGLLVVCHTVPAGEQAKIEPGVEGSGMRVYRMPLLISPPEFLGRVAELLS